MGKEAVLKHAEASQVDFDETDKASLMGWRFGRSFDRRGSL
jgi:hypothetical protein